jgi:hypothetical protein
MSPWKATRQHLEGNVYGFFLARGGRLHICVKPESLLSSAASRSALFLFIYQRKVIQKLSCDN